MIISPEVFERGKVRTLGTYDILRCSRLSRLARVRPTNAMDTENRRPQMRSATSVRGREGTFERVRLLTSTIAFHLSKLHILLVLFAAADANQGLLAAYVS